MPLFTGSLAHARIRLLGIGGAGSAILCLVAINSASFAVPLSDAALASIRGSHPQVCKVRGPDCTDMSIGLLIVTNGAPTVRGDSCTDNRPGSQCIACRSGTFSYTASQMSPPRPAIIPGSAFSQPCGLQSGTSTGSVGTCEEDGKGNMYCHYFDGFDCYSPFDYTAQ